VARIINYIPQRYHHRYPLWRLPVFHSALAVAILVAFYFFRNYVHPLAWVIIFFLIAIRLVEAGFTALGSWECRIEDGTLLWRSPATSWSRLEITQIVEVEEICFPHIIPNAGRWHHYELMPSHGERIFLDWRVFGHQFDKFKSVILSENSAVVFGTRNGI
jgi:hypothetical protein